MINASELKSDKRQQAIDYCMKWLEYYIKEANERGMNRVCLSPTWHTVNGVTIHVEDELKAILQRHGFRIKPTGYIGGVWQRTEDICW